MPAVAAPSIKALEEEIRLKKFEMPEGKTALKALEKPVVRTVVSALIRANEAHVQAILSSRDTSSYQVHDDKKRKGETVGRCIAELRMALNNPQEGNIRDPHLAGGVHNLIEAMVKAMVLDQYPNDRRYINEQLSPISR